MRRAYLFGLSLATIIGLALAYHRMASPLRSLTAARTAVSAHDLQTFRQYVDMDTLLQRAVIDPISASPPSASPDDSVAAMARVLSAALLPSVKESLKATIDTYVENGKLQLSGLLNVLGSSQEVAHRLPVEAYLSNLTVRATEGPTFDGDTATVVLLLHHPDFNDGDLTVTLRMRQLDPFHWQVMDAPDLIRTIGISGSKGSLWEARWTQREQEAISAVKGVPLPGPWSLSERLNVVANNRILKPHERDFEWSAVHQDGPKYEVVGRSDPFVAGWNVDLASGRVTSANANAEKVLSTSTWWLTSGDGDAFVYSADRVAGIGHSDALMLVVWCAAGTVKVGVVVNVAANDEIELSLDTDAATKERWTATRSSLVASNGRQLVSSLLSARTMRFGFTPTFGALRIATFEVGGLDEVFEQVARPCGVPWDNLGEGIPDDCRSQTDCRNWGKCTSEGGACVAKSDRDCRASMVACVAAGQCVASGGKCVATSSEDCEAAQYCFSYGRCVAREQECVATIEFCRRSPDCKTAGRCSVPPHGGPCIAASEHDCRVSTACRIFNECSLLEGQCVSSKSDCERWSGCTLYGLCSPAHGTCRAESDQECRASKRCRLSGECVAREGQCVAN